MEKQKVLLMLCVTRILAVRSWPDSSNWANSLLSCFIWASLLFFKSFMRETASFNVVLLHQTKQKLIRFNKTFCITLTGFNQSHRNWNRNWWIENEPLCGLEASMQHVLRKHTNWRTNDSFYLFIKERIAMMRLGFVLNRKSN